MIVACLVVTAVLVHPGLLHSTKADGGSSGTWAQTFSSGRPEFGASNAIQQTTDAGYILVGIANPFGQAWVIRLDASGNVIWENAYRGAGSMIANSVQQTSDDGFIVAGNAFGPGFDLAFLLRLDGDGNVIWENTYSGAGHAAANSVQQTSDDGFIVAGTTFASGLTDQAWILSLDGGGNVNWEKAYGGTGSFNVARSVQQTSDGGFIVAGQTNSFGPAGCCNAWVFRLDSDGNIVWENAYGDGSEIAWSVQQTSDGGFAVGVEDFSTFPGTEAAAVILLDGDGNIVWQHAYSTPGGCNAAVSVKQTTDNGFIVGTACDNTVLRLDDQGDIVWQNTYGGFADISSVQQTSDGGFVLAACCGANVAAFVAKIDSNGQIGSSCASITTSSLTQSDTSYTVTPSSATVTDTSGVDIVTPTSSTVTDTSSTDTVTLLCQD